MFEVRLAQIGPRQIDAAQLRLRAIGAAQHGRAHLRAAEIRAGTRRSGQRGLMHIRAGQAAFGEHGIVEFRAAQVGIAKFGAAKITLAHVGSGEAGVAEIDLAQPPPVQGRARKIGALTGTLPAHVVPLDAALSRHGLLPGIGGKTLREAKKQKTGARGGAARARQWRYHEVFMICHRYRTPDRG